MTADSITMDNGELFFLGHEAMEKLGQTLAASVIYANEYEKIHLKKKNKIVYFFKKDIIL